MSRSTWESVTVRLERSPHYIDMYKYISFIHFISQLCSPFVICFPSQIKCSIVIIPHNCTHRLFILSLVFCSDCHRSSLEFHSAYGFICRVIMFASVWVAVLFSSVFDLALLWILRLFFNILLIIIFNVQYFFFIILMLL